jgi:hypothetical protein
MTQLLKRSESSRPARRLTYYRIRRRVLKWRTLANARRSLPSILGVLSDGACARDARGWKLHWMTWAGSSALDTAPFPIGTRVVAGVGPDEGPALVIKIPSTCADIRQLRRGHDAIASIRTSPDIGDWNNLVANCVAEANDADRLFFVEAVLPGINAQELLVTIPEVELLRRAAHSIRGLHDATSVPVVVDADAFARWVGEPLRRVRHVLTAAHGAGHWKRALEALEGALREALLGRVLLAGWVHGDFWLGNVLMQPQGDRVTGVIDWDRARPAEVVAHDVVHLLLVHRMFAAPAQRFFGETVHSFLTGQEWSADERRVLSEAELPFSPRDTAGQNALVLLCWIRRMLMDMEATDSPPSKLWVSRNIDVVLSHFQH